jgi:ABC-type phosphate transport system substrate-binding protein
MMHSIRVAIITICIACIISFARVSFADEALAIIVGRSSALQNISLETLKRVYLRKNLIDGNGIRWIPLNYPPSHELRQAFSLELFKELPEDQENYWNTQYFNGISPPEVLASEEAVLRFVVITPGAIGYVRKRNVDERVKILKIISIAENR